MLRLSRQNCALFFTGNTERGLPPEIWLPYLAEQQGWSLAACDLKKTPTGQPQLRVDGRLIHCSISHAVGLTVVAFHPEFLIGIDAELIDETRSDFDLLATYFPDVKPSVKGSENNDSFLAYWTKTEAHLKAQGVGFLQSEISAPFDPLTKSISWIEAHEKSRWRISQICLSPSS
jgi:phosphopantetheinyl transferase